MHVADPRDLTFREALARRLAHLTPVEQRVVLGEALTWLRAVLPLLPARERHLLTMHLATALASAGYRGEAALVRLTVAERVPATGHHPNQPRQRL